MFFGGGCRGNYVGNPFSNIGKQIEGDLEKSDLTEVPVVTNGSVMPVVNYDLDKKVDEALSGCCGNHGAGNCKKQKSYQLG